MNEANNRPTSISRRAYDTIKEHVRSALRSNPHIRLSPTMIMISIIDPYLRSGVIPEYQGPSWAMGLFFGLKPQIDRHMASSRRAREAAKRRREERAERKKVVESCITGNAKEASALIKDFREAFQLMQRRLMRRFFGNADLINILAFIDRYENNSDGHADSSSDNPTDSHTDDHSCIPTDSPTDSLVPTGNAPQPHIPSARSGG